MGWELGGERDEGDEEDKYQMPNTKYQIATSIQLF
jgi:hypothetical protein